jgi:choline kinase
MTISFIIPAAGLGIRLKSEKPISLIKFEDEEFLYEKQINTIRKHFPEARIIYITGFNCDKIDKQIKNLDCEVVHNLSYSETSPAFSVSLGLKKVDGPAFLIYGNLFFDKKALTNLPKFDILKEENGFHSLLFTNKNIENGIGIGINQKFDYNFKEKWTKITYLSKECSAGFQEIVRQKPWKLIHEVIEKLIANGRCFKNIELNGTIIEIQKIKNIKEINKLLKDS